MDLEEGRIKGGILERLMPTSSLLLLKRGGLNFLARNASKLYLAASQSPTSAPPSSLRNFIYPDS